MFKIVSVFILFIYVVPFIIFFDGKFAFEFFQLMTIFMAFWLGSFILPKQKKYLSVDYSNFFIPSDKLLIITFLMYFIVNIQSCMDTFTHLVIYQDYASWALENAVKRYARESDEGALKKISSILFLMLMVFLGAYGFGKNWKKYYFFLFLVLIIESSGLARAGVLIGFTAYFNEFLIRQNYYFSKLKTVKLLKIGIILFVVLLVIFFFSAYLRIQNENNITDILVERMGEYLISHYEALLIWMESTDTYGNTFGASSFTALYKIITNIQVQDGFYDIVETRYGQTVIFTTIRGFLADFGYTFTVLIFFISGFYIKYFSYIRMSFYAYFFIRMILFLLLFFLYSPFLFATIFIGYILSYLIIGLDHMKFYKTRQRILI
jgi:oligosaccharide repeat unit polymerase